MLPRILHSRAHATDSPCYSKKCASLTSQPSAPRYRPEVTTVRTLHARDAIPHQVSALHRLRVPRRVGRCSTDAFETHAESSRGGTWRLLCTIRLHSARRVSRDETAPRDHANKRIMNMRAVRGQRSMWFCFWGRRNASNTVSRPLLSMKSLSRAVLTKSCPLFKKRASLSSQPRAPSSGPENAVVSTLHACDKKPHLVVAQTVVGIHE
jgi:hypothetical protein